MSTEQNVQSEQITQLFWDDTFISLKLPIHTNCARQNPKDDSVRFLYLGYPIKH